MASVEVPLPPRRLVTGAGCYTDDRMVPNLAYAAFLRAPVAHGRIRAIDVSGATKLRDVIAVFTAADVERLGFGGLRAMIAPPDDVPFANPARPLLAGEIVRYVGEPIALIVAESRAVAELAAERIVIDIETLPAAVDPTTAVTPGAPQVWAEAPGNVSFEWQTGDETAVRKAMADAARVVHLRLESQRISASPLEPPSATAIYDIATEQFTLFAPSQGTTPLRSQLAGQVLKTPPERLRIVTGDVGGGFGIRTWPTPEHGCLLMAAQATGRPIKWTATRGEAFLCDLHCREATMGGWLALDEGGHFLALRVEVDTTFGAYVSSAAAIVATRNFASGLAGAYLTPAISLRARGIFTHTAPTGPYRGAGRPEVAYMIERLVDAAGAELGIDRVVLRRRNLVPLERIPYRTPLGLTYDSGDFAAVLDAALARADWNGFAVRSAAAQARGRLRGIGLSLFATSAGVFLDETVDLRFTSDGRVEIRTSAQSTGQGHEATFTGLAARIIQIPAARISFICGDSAEVPPGAPTVASRGAMVTGGAIEVACRTAVERGRRIAAELLETNQEDVDFRNGSFAVRGTDRVLPLLELAQCSERRRAAGRPLAVALDAVETVSAAGATFPNGCHVAEVEIDPETGTIEVVGYSAVDDVGTVLNPAVVDGQIVGGIVQALGQACIERCIYDEHGQLITGSFLDYGLPRASDVPPIGLELRPAPSPVTPLGAKGAGEAGTAGALSAIMNAINHALAAAGAKPIDMPARPEVVRRALVDAARSR